MILSMTGFAVHSKAFHSGSLNLELRAVNHRYFELQMRLPEELRVIEHQLRQLIADKVSRGKLECRVSIHQMGHAVQALELNHAVLQRLIVMAQEVREQAGEDHGLSVGELMRWPGVMKTNELAPEILQQLCLDTLGTALESFNASRSREGEKLRAALEDRIASMASIIASIRPKLRTILDSYMSRLSSRLQEAMSHVDENRLRLEFSLFAQKIDIDEELTRLGTHLSEASRILQSSSHSGKRLDFLMQELNREANTLGAKSISTETTQASIELKVLIEQMREQIQNIE